jgi:hypothetical protein
MHVLFIPSPPNFSSCFITHQIPICLHLKMHSRFNPAALRYSPLCGVPPNMLMYFQITAVGCTTGVQFPAELGIIPFITHSTHTGCDPPSSLCDPVLTPRPLYAFMEWFLSDYIKSKSQRFNSELTVAQLVYSTTFHECNNKLTRWATILCRLNPIRKLTVVLCLVCLFSV